MTSIERNDHVISPVTRSANDSIHSSSSIEIRIFGKLFVELQASVFYLVRMWKVQSWGRDKTQKKMRKQTMSTKNRKKKEWKMESVHDSFFGENRAENYYSKNVRSGKYLKWLHSGNVSKTSAAPSRRRRCVFFSSGRCSFSPFHHLLFYSFVHVVSFWPGIYVRSPFANKYIRIENNGDKI